MTTTAPTPALTRADRGVLVIGALATLRERILAKSPDMAELNSLNQLYKEAVEQTVQATGARVKMAEVEANADDTEALVLAQAVKRMNTFLNKRFKGKPWNAVIDSIPRQAKNVVNRQFYNVVATITQGRDVLYFCTSTNGRFVCSDEKYWVIE